MENLNNNALVLTNGLLTSSDAKTAHGLIRGTERFNIIGYLALPLKHAFNKHQIYYDSLSG